MTRSEQFVHRLAQHSFLSLWTTPNPFRTKGKELCDAMVVFGNRILLISVKECVLDGTIDEALAAQRWQRAAVDASIQQLRGALRKLPSLREVLHEDGRVAMSLPPVSDRKCHLLAVAVGAQRQVEFGSSREGSCVDVHTVDEVGLFRALSELDTATDFFDYLDSKEAYCGRIVVIGGEENLVALYIHRGRTLAGLATHADADGTEVLVVDHHAWSDLHERREFVRSKALNRRSYWWDQFIETQTTAERRVEGTIGDEQELVLRTMAAENRHWRRILTYEAERWWAHCQKRETQGFRAMSSPNVGYVFLYASHELTRDQRTSWLQARCYVARRPEELNRAIVVGIAKGRAAPDGGFVYDTVWFQRPDWTPDDDRLAAETVERFGFLASASHARAAHPEFPMAPTRTERNKEKALRKRRRQ